jgi:hypothetical protein
MDSISTAIIAAIAAGVTDTGKKAFSDAYQGLKNLIQSRFGKDNKISKAIAEIEDEPESRGQKIVLTERITTAEADQDEDIISAAKALLKSIKETPDKETPEGRKVIGKYNIKTEKIGAAGDNMHIEGGVHVQ